MNQFKYQYPQDPIDDCLEMSRSEFLTQFPREPMRMLSGNNLDDLFQGKGHVEEFPVHPEAIYCDFCNDDPFQGGDKIFVINNGSKGLCQKCADKYVLPYKIPEN